MSQSRKSDDDDPIVLDVNGRVIAFVVFLVWVALVIAWNYG